MNVDLKLKEKIRLSNPIKDVVQEVTFLKGNLGRCPKHDDKHPSFSVDEKRGICRCWAGCTDGSLDVFGFCQWYYGDTFPEAVERLAKRTGITMQKSRRKKYKNDPYGRIKDLLVKDDISYQRWKREALKELGVMQATLSQRSRKKVYAQYERGVITKYGLETRLLALEKMDEDFDELDNAQAFRDLG